MNDLNTIRQIQQRDEVVSAILNIDGHDLGDGYSLTVEGPMTEPPIRSLALWFQGAWTGETPDDTLGDKRFHVGIQSDGEEFDHFDLILSGTELSANTQIEYGFLSPFVRDMDAFRLIGHVHDATSVGPLVSGQAHKLITQKNSEYSYSPIAAL